MPDVCDYSWFPKLSLTLASCSSHDVPSALIQDLIFEALWFPLRTRICMKWGCLVLKMWFWFWAHCVHLDLCWGITLGDISHQKKFKYTETVTTGVDPTWPREGAMCERQVEMLTALSCCSCMIWEASRVRPKAIYCIQPSQGTPLSHHLMTAAWEPSNNEAQLRHTQPAHGR